MSIADTLKQKHNTAWQTFNNEEIRDEMQSPKTSRHRRNFLLHRYFETYKEIVKLSKNAWQKDDLFQALLGAVDCGHNTGYSPSIEWVEEVLCSREPLSNQIAATLENFLEDLAFMRVLLEKFETELMGTLVEYYIDGRDANMPEYYAFLDPSYTMITKSPLTVTVTEDIEERLFLCELQLELTKHRQSWQLVVYQKDIETNLFDKASRALILSYSSYKNLEPFMRLIPDALVKSEHCLSEARDMWMMSDRRYRQRESRASLFRDTLQEVKDRLNDVFIEIEATEERKVYVEEQLSDLQWNHSQFEKVAKQQEEVKDTATMGEMETYELNKKRLALLDRVNKAKSSQDSYAFNCAYENYLECRRDYLTKKSETAVWRYQSDLLKDSLEIHTALKCSKLRSKGALEEDADSTKEELERLREEQEALELEMKALEDAINFSLQTEDTNIESPTPAKPLAISYQEENTAESKEESKVKDVPKLSIKLEDQVKHKRESVFADTDTPREDKSLNSSRASKTREESLETRRAKPLVSNVFPNESEENKSTVQARGRRESLKPLEDDSASDLVQALSEKSKTDEQTSSNIRKTAKTEHSLSKKSTEQKARKSRAEQCGKNTKWNI